MGRSARGSCQLASIPPIEPAKWCSNCGAAPPRANRLCVPCYQYRHRTGRDRPEEQIVAENIRRFEDEVERKRLRTLVLRAEEAEGRRSR